ncbi:hypothetical protein FGE12_22695 [Aggregicoccus sp. 17bor-14]|uniref:hypothetical protein n=1 Tax=Myxococcaceae TaxID=31 RepID=UPI00129CA760|nr:MULTISPECIES: hypothetical protein [Myxococcaceae]MBF5045231.1 hypothetical protein [Simulacricoccus sp. 17bor-14]MRI90972.1 hypothetical protein [Aggregicoccus sp. 17bor-14]
MFSSRRISFHRLTLPTLLALLFAAGAAHAQASRTWVSGVGDDVNPCSRTAPCKTFAGAISKTAAGGEIDALDPGGFGAVTVTKSITIDGAGMGSILASGTIGVVINAPGATVILRNLSINGAGSTVGTHGIRVIAAAAVYVENCTLFGFSGNLVWVAAPAATQVFVRNSTLNGDWSSGTASGNAASALRMEGGAAVVEKSQLARATVGVSAQNDAKVALHDSTLVGHVTAGVLAQGSSQVLLERGMVAQSGTGVQADAPAQVRLSDVMVGQNTQGLTGNVASFGNNRVAAGNGTDGAPSTQLPQN